MKRSLVVFFTVAISGAFLWLGMGLVIAEDRIGEWKRITQERMDEASGNGYRTDHENKPLTVPHGQREFYLGIGEATKHTFSDCCDKYVELVTRMVSGFDQNAKQKFIEFDFNDDGEVDFVTRIEGASFCEDDLCPTYLFLNQGGASYEKHDGPMVKSAQVGVTTVTTGNTHNLIFKSDVLGHCLWKWEYGADQEYYCVIGRASKPKEIEHQDMNTGD